MNEFIWIMTLFDMASYISLHIFKIINNYWMPFRRSISKYVFLSWDNIKHCNCSKLPSHHNFGQFCQVAGNGVDHDVSHGVGHWISIRISHGVSLTDSVRGLVTVSHGVNLTINHGVYHGVLDGSVLTCPELLTEQCNAKLSCLKVPISHHSQVKVKSFQGS